MRGTLSLALSEEDGAVSLIAMSMFIFSYPLSLSLVGHSGTNSGGHNSSFDVGNGLLPPLLP